MDIMSTVIGVVKTLAHLADFATFGLSGLALELAAAGFELVHGVVGLVDDHYNNGTVHPDLGEVGKFLATTAKVCSYVDTGLAFFDIGRLMKNAIKKNKDKIYKFGKQILEKVKSAGKAIAEIPRFLGKQGVRRVMVTGRQMFSRGKRAARQVISGSRGILRRAGGVMSDVGKMTKAGKYRGAVSRVFKGMKEVSMKFKSSNVFRKTLKTSQRIIRNVTDPRNLKKAAKGLYKFAEVVSPGRLKHVLRAIDWLTFGATNTTDAQNFLGRMAYAHSIIKGPVMARSAIKNYREQKFVRNMLMELRSGHRLAIKTNDLRIFQAMLGRMRGKRDESPAHQEMLLEMAQNVESIDALREYLRVQLEMLTVFEHLETMDKVLPIYENILKVQEEVQDSSKLKEVLSEMSGFITYLPKLELRDFVSEINNMTLELEENAETATATDVISLITTMDRGLSNVNFTETMDFLYDISEELWLDDGPTEFLEEAEAFVKSVEGVDPGFNLFSTLLEAEIGFSETKQLFKIFLKICQVSKSTEEFQAILRGMAEQLTSGADPGAVSRRIENLEVLMKHRRAAELQELFEQMLKKTESPSSLKAVLEGFADSGSVKKFSIKFADFKTIFRIFGASEGLESSGELYDVLNQLGTFTRSIKLQSLYRKISLFVQNMDHNPDIFESMHGLPDNITTHQFLKSLNSISRVEEILRDSDSGDFRSLLPSLFNVSKAVFDIGNMTKILGTIGEIGKLRMEESELIKVSDHFDKSLNSSSSLEELLGVYQVMVDTDKSPGWDKNVPLLMVKLVKNLHWHKEAYQFTDFLNRITSSSTNIQVLCEHLRIFMAPADDFDDLEDLTRTFANFTFTSENVKLFELIATGSKSISDFHKVIGALRVLTLDSKARSLKFLKFSDDLVDHVQSWKQLNKVLTYLGTAPEDVKSMAHSGDFIDGISGIVRDCIVYSKSPEKDGDIWKGIVRIVDAQRARACVEHATEAFFNMSDDSSGSIRRQLEAHERIADKAQDSETLHQMFLSTTLVSDNSSVDGFLKTSEFIGGWVKSETGDVKKTAYAMGVAMEAIATRAKTRKHRSVDNSFQEVVLPLLKNLGVSPFGIQNEGDFAKIEELVKGLDDPAKDLQDIQECSGAFERLGDGEKVREFFQVAEHFNYSDSSLGTLSESVISIGSPENVKEVPELVREVKSCPDAQEQVADMARLIPELTGLPSGVQGLTEPLMKLGVNDTMVFLNGSRVEILEKLKQEPGLGAHLKELVESLYSLDSRALGIIERGAFKRNSSITTRISTFLGNISTTRPILGLSNLSKTSKSFVNGTGTLENLDEVMGSMGNVSEAFETVRELPVVMTMRGCRDRKNHRKIQETLDSLSGADNTENILAINALEHIGEMYQNLSSGPETFEKMAGHLEPLSQLSGGLKQFQGILDEVEPDSEALESLAPNLEAIHEATNGSDVLEVVGQLEMVSAELNVLTELRDQIPEILEKVGVLVGVTTNRPSTSTVVYSTTQPTVIRAEALIAVISCALRKDSGALMACEGYCSLLERNGSSDKLWTTILAILAGTMLLLAVGVAIWRKLSPTAVASNDVEMKFSRSDSFSEQESGKGIGSRSSGPSTSSLSTTISSPAPRTPKSPTHPKKNSIHNLTKPKPHKDPHRDPLKSPTDSTESRPTTPTASTPARTPISPIHPKVQKLWK